MSVRHETYIFYGIQLPYDIELPKSGDDDFYDKVENLVLPWCGEKARGKVGFLFDGMNSEYIIFGYVIDVDNEDGEYFQNSVYSFGGNSELHKNLSLYKKEIIKYIDENSLDEVITPDTSKEFHNRNFDFLVVSHYH